MLEIIYKFLFILFFFDLSFYLLLFFFVVCKIVVDFVFLIDGFGSIEYYGCGNFKLMFNFIKFIVVMLFILKI